MSALTEPALGAPDDDVLYESLPMEEGLVLGACAGITGPEAGFSLYGLGPAAGLDCRAEAGAAAAAIAGSAAICCWGACSEAPLAAVGDTCGP